MTENIKLPPLPYPQIPGNDYAPRDMWDYALAAIKYDRKQHQLTLDGVYTQRNALAIAFAKAAIAAGWVAGRGFDSDAPKIWSDDWRHVVYVDLPDGSQVSWHMSPECVPLLDGLPEYTGAWDGTFIARDAEWCRFSYDRQQRGVPVAEVWSVQPGDEDSFGVVRFLTGDPDNMWSFPRQGDKLFLAPQPAQPSVPDGYRLCLVPMEHTDAFRNACSAAYEQFEKGTGPCGVFIAGHRSMLAAAPKFGEE